MDIKIDSSKLLAERNQRAWSQQHLSDVSGVSLRTIQRVEKGQSSSMDTARAIASAFDMAVHELYQREEADIERRSSPSVASSYMQIPRIRFHIYLFSMLAISIVGSILLSSTPTIASGVTVSSKSMTVNDLAKTAEFIEDVEIFIPNDVYFDIKLEISEAMESEKASQILLTIDSGKLVFDVANIVKTESGVVITSQKAILHKGNDTTR